MGDWIVKLIEQFSESPVLQGWIAAFGTLIMENVVCVAMSGLVASGLMLPKVAFWAATLGVFFGDIIIYLPCRYAMRYIDKLKWVEQNRKYIRVFEEFFSRHVGKTMFIIRFTPGIRTLALIAAGMLRVPLPTYLFYSFLSSVFQAVLVVGAGKYILDRPVAWFKALWQANPAVGISMLVALLVCFVILNAIIAKKISRHIDRKYTDDPHPLPHDATPCSGYEFWNPLFFYIPLFFYGLWLVIRYRSFRAPFSANTSIYASGAVKESKSAEYTLFPEAVREKWFARTAILPAMPTSTFQERADEAERLRDAAAITYPFVAKPDISYGGAGVRRIRNKTELLEYCKKYPRSQALLIQELLTDPVEASLVYMRKPGEAVGRIISLALRQTPYIVGDGIHTLRQLILNNNRARRIANVFFKKNQRYLDEVIPSGEQVPITFTGNHGQGAVSKNITSEISSALTQRIEEIVRSVKGLHWVRFDLRCRSLADLLNGEHFRMMEINGSGRSGEPVHIWDPETPLSEIYGTLAEMCRTVFEIGSQNRRAGYRGIGFTQYLRDRCFVKRLAHTYPDAE